MTQSEIVVIVGAGHAAGQVVASLKQNHFAGNIVLLGEEPWFPYQRPPLSKKFLAGELAAERLFFKPESFYDDANIDVRLNTRVTAIERDRKAVIAADGVQQDYDKLILALGARPRRIDLPGAELNGVHYLRGIADVEAIQEDMRPGRRLVIVGAGYIGLEVAAVAQQLGLEVTVVEMQGRVMSRVVSPAVSEFYEREHRERGVHLRLSTGIEGFTGQGRVSGVRLSGGEEIAADLVVIGIGVQPNTELAVAADLSVSDGIVVDDQCRTCDRDIFAVGDCTQHPNEIFGRRLRLESVHNALEQAKTAGQVISGHDVHYAQVPWFWSDQYDLKLQIVGLSEGYDQTIMRGSPGNRSFACLYLKDQVLIAVDAVNSPRDFMQAKQIIASQRRIDTKRCADDAVALKDV